MSGCGYCVKCKQSKEIDRSVMCIECLKQTRAFLAQTFAMDSDDLADLGVTIYQRKQTNDN